MPVFFYTMLGIVIMGVACLMGDATYSTTLSPRSLLLGVGIGFVFGTGLIWLMDRWVRG